jgi:DNA-binding NtrC family response regulator
MKRVIDHLTGRSPDTRLALPSGDIGASPVRIVAIEDDLEFLHFLTDVLSADGLEIVGETDAGRGLGLALNGSTDIVLVDLSSCNELEILDRITTFNPTISVILLTDHYSAESAVEAIQRGAADYLNKPISVDRLRRRVGKFVSIARERSRARELSHELVGTFQFDGIVGSSPLMLEVFDRIRHVGPHFKNILVSGETGTGKELVARALHRLSQATSGPFVVCNCAAVIQTLFESELFGHVRGAFTGALQDKKGYFELAHKGTLFLDEIGDASLEIQAKLLRVMQDHVVQRVGSPALHQIDVRVVAATNRDLRAMVMEKQFREDLYYRISAVEIKVPPLNRRKEDLPLLERYFVEHYAAEYKKKLRGISRKAQIILSRYFWPGNVRELENVLAHACMMAQGEVIEVRDLPDVLQNELPNITDEEIDLCSLQLIQYRHISRILKYARNNKLQAAEILGISRTTLYRFLAEIEARRREERDARFH